MTCESLKSSYLPSKKYYRKRSYNIKRNFKELVIYNLKKKNTIIHLHIHKV